MQKKLIQFMLWRMIAEVLASRGQRDIERCIARFLAICDDYSDNNTNPAEKCAVRAATRVSWIAIGGIAKLQGWVITASAG